MDIEYKAVGVSGVTKVAEEKGVVLTYVSVTGLKDNVNDTILPGAYTKSLAARKPKGVWHHDWTKPVSRTEMIKELLPGDADLPTELPDGTPWPKQAGALMVKTRFNLNTERGRDAYEDVLFYGKDAEWSIGYNVPKGGATIDAKSGHRTISELDLYEYSPVLFGAMPIARTATVKEAQSAFAEIKTLRGAEAENFLIEMKSVLGDDAFVSATKGMEHDGDWEDEEEPKEEEKAVNSAAQTAVLLDAVDALQKVLGGGTTGQRDLPTLLKKAGFTGANIQAKAEAFEAANAASDPVGMEEAATPIFEQIEDSDADPQALSEVGEYLADQFGEFEDVEDPDGESVNLEELDPEDEEDPEPIEEGKGEKVKIDLKALYADLELPDDLKA